MLSAKLSNGKSDIPAPSVNRSVMPVAALAKKIQKSAT